MKCKRLEEIYLKDAKGQKKRRIYIPPDLSVKAARQVRLQLVHPNSCASKSKVKLGVSLEMESEKMTQTGPTSLVDRSEKPPVSSVLQTCQNHAISKDPTGLEYLADQSKFEPDFSVSPTDRILFSGRVGSYRRLLKILDSTCRAYMADRSDLLWAFLSRISARVPFFCCDFEWRVGLCFTQISDLISSLDCRIKGRDFLRFRNYIKPCFKI